MPSPLGARSGRLACACASRPLGTCAAGRHGTAGRAEMSGSGTLRGGGGRGVQVVLPIVRGEDFVHYSMLDDPDFKMPRQ